jgi:phosphoserine aminotransferase
MTRVMNFNAGPAALPLPALERAKAELTDFAGSGMSVMEHSHRGKEYEAVHAEAMSLLRELMSIPDGYDVLFVQGGASMQFAQVPMSFLENGQSADYVVNGAWGEKAVAEANVVAAQYGARVRVAATTAENEKYGRAAEQRDLTLDPNASYVHFTSNETIHGIQYASFPDFGAAPVVCDMSSDFLSRVVDVSKMSFIYAGAQKNIGPSGVVVVVAKKSFVARGRKDIPKIFQYRTHEESGSLYNTPPTFGVYLMRNVLAWVKDQGGLAAIEKVNREKGRVLYGAIDANAGFYRCPVAPNSRSLMNAVFYLPTPALDEKLVAEAKANGMVGLKGHRTVGGVRVSTYNAVSLEWVKALADFMKEFVKKNG